MTRNEHRRNQVGHDPYHVEAAALGANIDNVTSGLARKPATTIRQAWDYTIAKLNVDQARAHINRWTRRAYHLPSAPAETGRILCLQEQVASTKAWYMESVDSLKGLPEDVLPTWSTRRSIWFASGRALITERHESAEWGRKHGKYPTHTEVSYCTYLLRPDWETPPSTKQIVAKHWHRGTAIGSRECSMSYSPVRSTSPSRAPRSATKPSR